LALHRLRICEKVRDYCVVIGCHNTTNDKD